MIALIHRVVVRIVHVTRHGFQHAHAEPAAEANEFGHSGRIAADIRGYDERPRGLLKGVDEARGRGFGKRNRRDRRPLRDVNRNALGFRFHDFTGADEVDRSLGVAMGDLQRSMHDRLHVARVTKLVVVFHVLADDAALIGYVLNPLDEFVAATGRLALLGGRRQAGEDKHGNARFRGVVDRPAQRLRPAVDMDHDGLGAPGQLRVTVGASHGDHFMRTRDDGGYRPARGSRLGDRLYESRMVAAEIGEDVGDPRFLQRLQHRRARGIHRTFSPIPRVAWTQRCAVGPSDHRPGFWPLNFAAS